MNKKNVTNKKLETSDVSENDSQLNLIRFIVQRFELNDPTNPTYYIVGFKLICDINQREGYLETHIDFKSCNGMSDNEICMIAYSNLKPKIEITKSDLLKKRFIVGSEFVPPVQ